MMNREAAAYHESGHAVVGHILGLAVRDVSISPEPDGGGRTRFKSRLFPRQEDWWEREDIGTGIRAQRAIIVALAGPCAQRRYDPHSDWQQDHHDHSVNDPTDFGHIKDLIGRLHGGRLEVARPFKEYLEARTEQLVEVHWQRIKRLATALIAQGTVTDIRAAMNSELLAQLGIAIGGR